jgi:hypothetical protein
MENADDGGTREPREHLLAVAARAGAMPEGRFAGRGIVVCAGGPVMLTNAWVLLRVLRDVHGCTLPIEIWHLGAREMPALLAGLFEDLGCRAIDAEDVRTHHPAAIEDGWQLKAYALVHSGFEQVLMLDADQVPLLDPVVLFDWPRFRETGAVFWPDIVELSEDNPVWETLGLAPRRTRSLETGQILLDKRACWPALAVALRMNELAETFYAQIYGDKDTFLLAWELTGTARAPLPPVPVVDQKYLGQRDFDGTVIFQHRTNTKWSLHRPNEAPEGFLLQAECEVFLEELRRLWNGFIFDVPDRSAAARALETELVARRAFRLTEVPDPDVAIELLAHHQFGAGRTHRLSNWYVGDGAGGPELRILGDNDRLTLALTPAGDGSWHGRVHAPVPAAARLEPAAAPDAAPAAGAPGLVDDLVAAARRACDTGGAGPDDLTAALRLLVRVEPAATAALQRCAADLAAHDPALAERLAGLADELAAHADAADRDPDRGGGALFQGSGHYRRP